MMLMRWFGTHAITAIERDLLATIRPSAIPDPDTLRQRLAALNRQIAEAENEWDRLDARAGDPRAFLKRQPVAERLQHLREQAAPLPAAIEAAERRRAAFLSLTRLFDALSAEVSSRLSRLLEHPPQDARERDAQLRALDDATRLHSRLAGHLAAISTSRQFKDPPDALRTLRMDLELRSRELDRLRVPGHKPRFEWPEAIAELLDTVENRERKTA